NQGVHADVFRTRSEGIWLERRRDKRKWPPDRVARFDARNCSGGERRIAFRGLELPRRPEQRHHSNGRHRGALLSDVRLNLRLGKHRSPEVRSVTTFQNEDHVSTPLFLNSEPQPGVLLQRRARDQVALVQRGQEQVPRRRAQLRGLKLGSKTWG